MNTIIEKAEEALSQSRQMNLAAKDGDWEAVQNLQAVHSKLISLIAKADIPSDQTLQLREMLSSIRKLNAETENLAEENKKRLVQEKKTLGKASKMQQTLEAFK